MKANVIELTTNEMKSQEVKKKKRINTREGMVENASLLEKIIHVVVKGVLILIAF